MRDFFATSRPALEQWLGEAGYSPVHAKALLRSAYRDLNYDFAGVASLPQGLQMLLPQSFATSGPALRTAMVQRSAYDHSVKFLLSLADDQKVEMVVMPEKTRITVCVSSQVGCAQACVFCHTGRMGLSRNLTAGEIVGQVVLANQWIAANPEWLATVRLPGNQRVSNVVFMGMGEPLDNTAAVIDALSILQEPFGLGLAPRRITVSTAGHLDGLRELLAAHSNVGLALSLHASEERERSRLMPINRRFPMAAVLAFLAEHTAKTGRPVLIQYTVIAGVNDTAEHAARLVRLLAGMAVKVNLIPLNPISASRLQAPAPEGLHAMADHLLRAGIRTLIRYSKGQDIAAACGQLVVGQN